MDKKYKLTDEYIVHYGIKLFRIEALKDFRNVRKGDKGGFVENENNLSHDEDCWISGDAKVYGDASVYENAKIFGNASVYGYAKVYGNANIYENAEIYGTAIVHCNSFVFGYANVFDDSEVHGNAIVYGNAELSNDAEVSSNTDYIVFKNWWSSGRYFTWTRSNNMWRVGCFYGSGEELIKKAYKDSEKSGREYERVVKYVESILSDEKKYIELKPPKKFGGFIFYY